MSEYTANRALEWYSFNLSWLKDVERGLEA